MEIVYTWTIIKMQVILDVDSMLNVVNNASFVVKAEKDGIIVTSRELESYFPQPEVGTQFIAYDDLTNDIVAGWCQQVLGPEFISGLYSRLSERINLILTNQDPITKPLPW